MSERAEDIIVRILIEALDRLHDDMDRVELLTAVLSSFQRPVPDYLPGAAYLLPSRKAASAERRGSSALRPHEPGGNLAEPQIADKNHWRRPV